MQHKCADFATVQSLTITLASAIEATPENLRLVTTTSATQQLVARVRGEPRRRLRISIGFLRPGRRSGCPRRTASCSVISASRSYPGFMCALSAGMESP